MTRIVATAFGVLWFGIIGTSAVQAQTGVRAKDPALQAAVPADLLKTEEVREAAMFAGDEKTWMRYTTADFVFLTSDGSVQTRAGRGGGINGVKITGPRVSEKDYHVHGDTVLVTSLRQQSAEPYRQMTVWVKEDGVWKVASVQHTPVSKK